MTRLYAILGSIAGLFAAFFSVLRAGKKSAKQEAELTEAKQEVKAHETRIEVERDIASGGDAVSKLRDKWKRPK